MKKKNIIGLVLLAFVGAMLIAPASSLFAGVYLVSMLTSPIWGSALPSGILGENPPMTEADLLVKIKSKFDESSKEFKTAFDVQLEAKGKELKELNEKFIALEAKGKDLKSVEEFKILAKECSDLAIEVKSLKENGIEKKDMKPSEMIEKALDIQKADIAAIVTKGGKVKLNYKSAAAIASANFGAGVLQGLRLPGVDPLDRNEQTILPEITIINGGPGSDPFSWVEKVVKEGGAAGVTESQNKPLYDWTYVENAIL